LDYDALHSSEPDITGETVARAKRTARAEARRRYRAATEPAFDADFETTEAAPATRAVRQPTPSVKPDSGQERVGVFGALRVSIHPVHVREDLVALPSLATHRAMWLPILTIAASAVATSITRGQDVATPFLFTYFVVTPAIGAVFLAGFLAPKASWLIGIVVSLIAAICYIVMGYAGLLPSPFAEQFAKVPFEASVSTLLFAPLMGALFAAAAAWYRRFLRLSNPARARQAASPRRGDGRSRATNGSQKAGARR